MQVDFHHGVTYVLARLAGFPKDEAETIAYASQFVDDAVDQGRIYFDNESIFEFIAAAHRMLDYRNFEQLANHYVWIPFHFLPANESDPKLHGKVPDFVQRAVCRPNSCTAQEMVRLAIQNKNHPNALHRLGITAHVYADTWAHQGFAGISHHINTVHSVCDSEGNIDDSMHQDLKSKFGQDWFNKAKSFIESKLVNEFAPVGHGPVLSYPDRPYLHWQYHDWQDRLVDRDNPKTFMDAIDHVFQALKRFRRGDHTAKVHGLPREDRKKIEELIRDIQDPDGEKRHQLWLKEIASGAFSFGPEQLSYVATGPGSWRHEVFPQVDSECDLEAWLKSHDGKKVPYPENFPFSHWKLFHDALECHRTAILNFILPQYGIVAA